ncbi:hypothetical protein FKM82_008133 [Ascaphus truei]
MARMSRRPGSGTVLPGGGTRIPPPGRDPGCGNYRGRTKNVVQGRPSGRYRHTGGPAGGQRAKQGQLAGAHIQSQRIGTQVNGR